MVAHHPGTRTERSEGEDLGTPSQTLLSPFLEGGSKNPKNFTEKGIPPTEAPENFRVPLVGGMPFSVKFFGFLNLSSKKGLGGVWGGAPRSYPSSQAAVIRAAV